MFLFQITIYWHFESLTQIWAAHTSKFVLSRLGMTYILKPVRLQPNEILGGTLTLLVIRVIQPCFHKMKNEADLPAAHTKVKYF